MIYELQCHRCGDQFAAKRRDAKFCCVRCAQNARRDSREYKNCAACGVRFLGGKKTDCCSRVCYKTHRRNLNREYMREAVRRKKIPTAKCFDCNHYKNRLCEIAPSEHKSTNAVALRIMGMCPRRGETK